MASNYSSDMEDEPTAIETNKDYAITEERLQSLNTDTIRSLLIED